jgi:flagellar motility protein MotE (MotC chaperone)
MKYNAKIALFGLLTVALGSSLSWNPENTQIARNVISTTPEFEEKILASTASPADTAAAIPSAPKPAAAPAAPAAAKADAAAVAPSAEEKARQEADKQKNEIARLEKKIDEMIKAKKEEETKKAADAAPMRERKPKIQVARLVNMCSDDFNSDDDDDLDDDDEEDYEYENFSGRDRYNDSNEASGKSKHFNCLSKTMSGRLQECSKQFNKSKKSIDKNLPDEERANLLKSAVRVRNACQKTVETFYKNEVREDLKKAASAPPNSPLIRQGASLANFMISEMPKGGPFDAIREDVTKLYTIGTFQRAESLKEDVANLFGNTPAAQVAGTNFMRNYIACEMGPLATVTSCNPSNLVAVNQLTGKSVRANRNSEVGLSLKWAWSRNSNALKQHYTDYLTPLTQLNGPTTLEGLIMEGDINDKRPGIAGGTLAPKSVTPGARRETFGNFKVPTKPLSSSRPDLASKTQSGGVTAPFNPAPPSLGRNGPSLLPPTHQGVNAKAGPNTAQGASTATGANGRQINPVRTKTK